MLRFTFAMAFLTIFYITGCSNNANSPVAPQHHDFSPVTLSESLAVMVDTLDESGNPMSGAGIFGLFNVLVDPVKMSAELIPVREVALDDVLEMVDITNFLSLAPCTDCVKIQNIQVTSEGYIGLNIGVKHPFPAGDPLKPISGRNRADLHVFNIEGTVIFNDSAGIKHFPGIGEKVGPHCLVNADGYSSYLDPVLDNIFPTQATIHPYILHFDDYSEGNFNPSSPTGFESVVYPPPTGNLVMAMGCDYDVKQYLFDIPEGSSFDFIYAVGCSYGVSSANKSQRFSPEYKVPQHNKKAASEVMVEITDNQLIGGDTNSTCSILVKVLDISHGVPVGSALNQMKADSSVAGIKLEVPGVTSGPVIGSTTPIGGNGRNPNDPLKFAVTFKNELGASQGNYLGLVKVLDSYTTGLNESPLLGGKDAIKRVDPLLNPLTGLYSLDEFATYMVFNVSIGEESHTPVASFITNPSGNPNLSFDFLDYRYITFTSTSTDPDDPSTPAGQIVSYEWDFVWDGDPAHFQDDTNGMGTGQEVWEVDRAGTWRAGLRVTDGGTPPLTSEIYSIEITVAPWSDELVISVNDGRVPKIAEMGGGDLMCIWVANVNRTEYAIFDGQFSDPLQKWSAPGVVSSDYPTYLSVFGGPGENEAWASGSIRQYRYNGTSWALTGGAGIIAHNRMCHIYANDDGTYGVFNNTIDAFGFVTRIHWPNISSYWYSFLQYIWLYGGNNRVLGESRIFDKDSSDQYYLVYRQDFAIDPYQPPQDMRYLLCAKLPESTQGYTHSVIDSGPQDTLNSVVIACDKNNKLHVAYLSQPNGGGPYSIYYKSSSDGAVNWGSQSTIWTGSQMPEAEYISIDTDSNNNIMVTYRVGNNIYWTYSANGTNWSTPEIVNTTYPGGTIVDKEQFMLVDSRRWTHVVWDRAPGSLGFGPIKHKVRAPVS